MRFFVIEGYLADANLPEVLVVEKNARNGRVKYWF